MPGRIPTLLMTFYFFSASFAIPDGVLLAFAIRILFTPFLT
jgi:hypothetical protein